MNIQHFSEFKPLGIISNNHSSFNTNSSASSKLQQTHASSSLSSFATKTQKTRTKSGLEYDTVDNQILLSYHQQEKRFITQKAEQQQEQRHDDESYKTKENKNQDFNPLENPFFESELLITHSKLIHSTEGGHRRVYEFNQPIKQAIFCHLKQDEFEKDKEKLVSMIAVLLQDASLHFLSEEGRNYLTKLSCSNCKLWALDTGGLLIQNLSSSSHVTYPKRHTRFLYLHHPLEPLASVTYDSGYHFENVDVISEMLMIAHFKKNQFMTFIPSEKCHKLWSLEIKRRSISSSSSRLSSPNGIRTSGHHSLLGGEGGRMSSDHPSSSHSKKYSLSKTESIASLNRFAADIDANIEDYELSLEQSKEFGVRFLPIGCFPCLEGGQIASDSFLVHDHRSQPVYCFHYKDQHQLEGFSLSEPSTHKPICVPALACLPIQWSRSDANDLLVLKTDNTLCIWFGYSGIVSCDLSHSRLSHLIGTEIQVGSAKRRRSSPSNLLLNENDFLISHGASSTIQSSSRQHQVAQSRSPSRAFRIIDLEHGTLSKVNLVLSSGHSIRASLPLLELGEWTKTLLKALSKVIEPLKYEFFFRRLCCQESYSKLSEVENFFMVFFSFLHDHPTCRSSSPSIDFESSSSNSNMSDFEYFQKYSGYQFQPNHVHKADIDFEKLFDESKDIHYRNHTDPHLLKELPLIIYAFHLVYEELKVSRLFQSQFNLFGQFLNLISRSIEWENWSRYYCGESKRSHHKNDINNIFNESCLPAISVSKLHEITQHPLSQFNPPNIYHWIESAWNGNQPSYLPSDSVIVPSIDFLPYTFKLMQIFPVLFNGTANHSSQSQIIDALNRFLNQEFIDGLPVSLALILLDRLSIFKSHPLYGFNDGVLSVLDRKDILCRHPKIHDTKQSRETSMKEPELLDKNKIKEKIMTQAHEDEKQNLENQEYKQNVTQLRFCRDNRVEEAFKSFKTDASLVIKLELAPQLTDEQVVQAQQQALIKAANRVFASACGRALMTFGTKGQVTDKKVHVPEIEISARLPPVNSLIKLDINNLGAEVMEWPEFHMGVAAGLRLCSDQFWVDGSWILYNRPQVLDAQHAGILFALGLKGHLKSMVAWQSFSYLQAKHSKSTIAILLGLSGAYLGEMDSGVTRMLCVHIPSMLPPLSLEVLPETQMAAIVGLGLLYMKTNHRRMTEVLLSELTISAFKHDEFAEGHGVSAGFGLGFVVLGAGHEAKGLQDMMILENLIKCINGKTLSSNGETSQNTKFNVDVTAPGALVALALIFLQTQDENVAMIIDTPDTTKLLEYIRPDILMLRVICKYLILWNDIEPSRKWIDSCIPEFVVNHGNHDVLVRAYQSILAGLCFCIALKYTGSMNAEAYDCLDIYLDFISKAASSSAISYAQKLNRSNARMCLDVLVTSISIVMAGSGNLALFEKLNKLASRTSPDMTYGNHMATHMAVGLLFMGGGKTTLTNSPKSIAMLFCAFYPVYPSHVQDNHVHLQALRHLWALVAENRCLMTVDVDTGELCSVPVVVKMKSYFEDADEQRHKEERAGKNEMTDILVEEIRRQDDTEMIEVRMMTPCLLPYRELIDSIHVRSPRYWNREFSKQDLIWQKDGLEPVAVKRKTGHLTYVMDPKGHKSILARSFASNALITDASKNVNDLLAQCLTDGYLQSFTQHLCNESQVHDESEKHAVHFNLSLLYDCIVSDRVEWIRLLMELYKEAMKVSHVDKFGNSTQHNHDISFSLFEFQVDLLDSYFASQGLTNVLLTSLQMKLHSKQNVDLTKLVFDEQDFEIEESSLHELVETFNL